MLLLKVVKRNLENENECLLDSAIIRTGKGAENYIGKKIVPLLESMYTYGVEYSQDKKSSK